MERCIEGWRQRILLADLGSVSAVLLENAGRRKLAELMANHVFGYEHGIKNLAVVNKKRVADKVGRDGRPARPGLDRTLGGRLIHLIDLFEQMLLNERTFF